MRGLGRGRWKSTCKGNSLAAYSTVRGVLRKQDHSDVALLPDQLRGCLENRLFGQSAHHQANHSNIDHSLAATRQSFIVLG